MDLNKALLIGRVTKDVELRQTPGGIPVATTSLATNKKYTNKAGKKVENAEFHNLVFWGKTAELASQYCKKGSLLYVSGRIVTRSWDDKSGTKRYTTEIQVEEMQFGPRPSGEKAEVREKDNQSNDYPLQDLGDEEENFLSGE